MQFENTVTEKGTCVCVRVLLHLFFLCCWQNVHQFFKTLKKLQIFLAFDTELRVELNNGMGKSSDFMGDTSMKTVEWKSTKKLLQHP